jgi:hypothetical protein
MAALDVYIDCDRHAVVASALNSSRKDLPRFVQGDTLSLRIHLLKGYDPVSSAYEVIPTTGLTLAVAVGTDPPSGTDDPSPEYYASNLVSWTESEDLDCFEGMLSFATDEVNALLDGVSKATATLQIYRTDEGYPNTILLQQTTVYANVIKTGGINPQIEPTPVSVTVGNTLWLPKAGAAEFILIDQTTGDKLRLWFADGILQQEVISA